MDASECGEGNKENELLGAIQVAIEMAIEVVIEVAIEIGS